MNISIKVIPHAEQRYPTAGDYWIDGDNLEIRISAMGDWRHETLVAIHELVEAWLCIDRKITIQAIDNFDTSFKQEGEPGDHPSSPYQNEHNLATGIERIACSALNIKWEEYDGAIAKL